MVEYEEQDTGYFGRFPNLAYHHVRYSAGAHTNCFSVSWTLVAVAVAVRR